MTSLLIFLLGMCWGVFLSATVVVLREGWKYGKREEEIERISGILEDLERKVYSPLDVEGYNPRRYGKGE